MKIETDAKQVTMWAWYPNFEPVVDQFNKTHKDVQICWTNTGAGNDEYTKFSTAIQAGSPRPKTPITFKLRQDGRALLWPRRVIYIRLGQERG